MAIVPHPIYGRIAIRPYNPRMTRNFASKPHNFNKLQRLDIFAVLVDAHIAS